MSDIKDLFKKSGEMEDLEQKNLLMSDIKDLYIKKLGEMEDLEQRKLLRNIMNGFFLNLIEYQEDANRKLEERIFNEVEDIERKYDVYVSVCSRSAVDPIDKFLYPVFKEDAEEKKIDLQDIAEKISSKEKIKLCTVFMKCDYNTLNILKYNKKSYKGFITTDLKKYPIVVKIEQNTSYEEEIHKLYNIFQKNNIPWKTINNPYVNRFFDILLVECEGDIGEEEEITEITFSLEEYEKYKVPDAVLLWNIERLSLKSDGFPMPAVDRINYEHLISLKKLGIANGYLVNEEENLIRCIKYMEEDLMIVSPLEKANMWHILKVTQPQEDYSQKYEYELVSNCRESSFINKYAQKQSSIIRSKGEIERIVNSFKVSKYFVLEGIEISNSKDANALTYDLNAFIIDDIRIGNDKKIMKLKFKSNNKNYFIINDLLSFIVSEVQMYFPEYECEGEII